MQTTHALSLQNFQLKILTVFHTFNNWTFQSNKTIKFRKIGIYNNLLQLRPFSDINSHSTDFRTSIIEIVLFPIKCHPNN